MIDNDMTDKDTYDESDFEVASPTIDDLRPLVAGNGRDGGVYLIGAGAALLGAVAFLWMGTQRSSADTDASALVFAASASGGAITAPPPPPELLEIAAQAPGAQSSRPGPPIEVPNAVPVAIPSTIPRPVSAQAQTTDADTAQRRHAPSLVVDLDPAGTRAAAAGGQSGPTTTAPTGPSGLDRDETFAARVGGADPDTVQATTLRNPQSLVPQGAVIPGVLETALNSDLPGFARAVVSRDVLSFTGSSVLIPRGSRVVGQYSSGVAQGQSRVFVIWTRIITPAGTSIQIGSPGADALGRAGLDGRADRHFFERFGGAVLLSVLNGAVAGLSDGPNTQIVIGSGQQASVLGAAASAPSDIAPTIKVAQGTPIRIFVARDLDFSTTRIAAAETR